MDRPVRGRGRRPVVLMILTTLLMAGLAASGSADLLPGEQQTGPALVGSLFATQVTTTDVAVTFIGRCRGKDVSFTQTLSPSPITIDANTTAESLEGLRFQAPGPVSPECPLQNLIVNTVVTPKFMHNNGTSVTAAETVLLFVVSSP